MAPIPGVQSGVLFLEEEQLRAVYLARCTLADQSERAALLRGVAASAEHGAVRELALSLSADSNVSGLALLRAEDLALGAADASPAGCLLPLSLLPR